MKKYLGWTKRLSRPPFVACLLLLFFIITLWVSRYKVILDYGVETDFLSRFIRSAEHILHGEPPSDPWLGPGYPLLLLPGRMLLGQASYFSMGQYISIFSAIGFVLTWYLIASRLLHRKSAAWLSTFIVVMPHFLVFTLTLSTDMVYALLISAALYFTLKSRKPLSLFFSGATLGYAYLVRYNALPLFGVLILGLLFIPRKIGFIGRLKDAFWLSLAFIIIIAPWHYCNARIHGNPFYSKSHVVVATHIYGDDPFTSEGRAPFENKFSGISDVFFYNPRAFIKKLCTDFLNRARNLLPDLIPFPMYFFVVVGLLIFLRSLDFEKSLLLVYVVVFLLTSLLIGYKLRYYAFVYPFFILMALVLFDRETSGPLHWIPRKMGRLSFVVAGLFIVYCVYLLIPSVQEKIRQQPFELIPVAEKIREHRGERPIAVIARKEHIAFAANAEKFVFMRDLPTLEEVIGSAPEEHDVFLFYSRRMEGRYRPQFSYLLNPEEAPENLELIHANEVQEHVLYLIH